jgi:hypothetical protein
MRFDLASLDILARAAVLSQGTISMEALSRSLREESVGSADFQNRYAFQVRDLLERWDKGVSWDAKSGWDGVLGLTGFDSFAERVLTDVAKANGGTVNLAIAVRNWEEETKEILDYILARAGNLSTDDDQ